MTEVVRVTDGSECQAHRSHRPVPHVSERHHVIPVAWQLHTVTPAAPPAPGPDPDGRGQLWDDRSVWLCPTGHRDVHYWIVRLMREIARLGSDDIEGAVKPVRPAGRAPAEWPIAVLALERYAPYGSLVALTQEREWGES